MIDFDLKPKDGQWTESRIQLYYLQQMALQMERMTTEAERKNRLSDVLDKERDLRCVSECALLLMTNKDEIIGLFTGNYRNKMPLADFHKQLDFRRKSILLWGLTRMTLVKAIAKTDYLIVNPVGSGYQVSVIRGDEVTEL